jgi:hypothetical protein
MLQRPPDEGDLMPSFAERLAALAKNPKARAALEKAREQAAKPENKARIEKVRARFGGRGPGAKS